MRLLKPGSAKIPDGLQVLQACLISRHPSKVLKVLVRVVGEAVGVAVELVPGGTGSDEADAFHVGADVFNVGVTRCEDIEDLFSDPDQEDIISKTTECENA